MLRREVLCAGAGEALRGTLSDGTRALADLAFDPAGARLAVGTRDGTVALWNWAEAAMVRRLEHGRGTTCPAWSPDGARLLTMPLQKSLVWLDSVPFRERGRPGAPAVR